MFNMDTGRVLYIKIFAKLIRSIEKKLRLLLIKKNQPTDQPC
jgi:hypothetical protein